MYVYLYSEQLFFIGECSITLYSWQEQNLCDGKK